jgi:hypothetical protein
MPLKKNQDVAENGGMLATSLHFKGKANDDSYDEILYLENMSQYV